MVSKALVVRLSQASLAGVGAGAGAKLDNLGFLGNKVN